MDRKNPDTIFCLNESDEVGGRHKVEFSAALESTRKQWDSRTCANGRFAGLSTEPNLSSCILTPTNTDCVRACVRVCYAVSILIEKGKPTTYMR